MKKYYVIIASMIMFASLIEFVYQEPEFTEPRHDWGGNYVGVEPYCTHYYWKQVENIPELYELIEPDCYI